MIDLPGASCLSFFSLPLRAGEHAREDLHMLQMLHMLHVPLPLHAQEDLHMREGVGAGASVLLVIRGMCSMCSMCSMCRG